MPRFKIVVSSANGRAGEEFEIDAETEDIARANAEASSPPTFYIRSITKIRD